MFTVFSGHLEAIATYHDLDRAMDAAAALAKKDNTRPPYLATVAEIVPPCMHVYYLPALFRELEDPESFQWKGATICIRLKG